MSKNRHDTEEQRDTILPSRAKSAARCFLLDNNKKLRVSDRITIRSSNIQFDCGINFNTVIMCQWYEATYVYHYPLLLPSPRRRTCPPNFHLLQIMTETNLRNGIEGFRKRFRFEDFKKFTRLSDREGHFLSYLSAVEANSKYGIISEGDLRIIANL